MKSLIQKASQLTAVCKLLGCLSTFALLTGALLPTSQAMASSTSVTNVVYQGRIIKPDGSPLSEAGVQFTLQVYGNSTLLGNGTAGADRCLLYQETQIVDMSNSGGAFQIYLGNGTSPTFGSGVSSLLTVFRNPQTNSPAASEAIGAISCSSGQTKFLSSSWDNNRELAVTVTTSSTVLNLSAMAIQAVPYAQQALQLGGYSSDYLMRVQTSRPGTANNFSANQFDFLLNLGINAVTPGSPSTYQVTNLLANDPTTAQQVATKNYVDTKVAASSLTVSTDGVTLQGDGSSGNKLQIKNLGVGTAQLQDGSVTMSKINQAGATSGQVLKWNGSAWAPAADAGLTAETDPTVSAWAKIANPPSARFSTTGNTLDLTASGVTAGSYGSATQIPIFTVDAYGRVTAASSAAISTSPTGQTLNSAQIWVGNASNVAEPVSISGDASLSNTGSLTLASTGVTAGSYTKVTVDAKGRVTSGSSPTSLSGYGITDAVQNAGGAPSVQEGTAAAIPSAGTAGRLYLATDTKILYRDNGTSWDSIGAAGSVTSVAASSPLQSSGGSTPTVSFINQNANLVLAGPSSGGSAAPTFRSLVAADLPSASGDVSGSFGSLSVDKIKGIAVSATAPTSNQVLQYNGSAWAPATISTSPVGQALNSAQVWVGNAGNLAEPVTLSGDATMDNTGALTLNTVPVTKGGTGVTSYSLGQIPVYDGTKLTGLGCSTGQVLQWQAGTGFGCVTMTGVSPVGSSLTSAQIWVGNASNVAEPVAASGDVTLSNTGAFKVTQIQGVAVNSTAPTSNQVLQYNGSQWVASTLSASLPSLNSNNIWLGNASNVASPIAVPTCAANNYLTFDGTSFSCALDQGSTGTVSSISATAPLAVSSSTGAVTASMTLNSGHVYVGNASNLAADVAMSGDATISSAGAVTNTGLQGRTVASTAPSANQVLQWNGSAWAPATISTSPVGQALNSAQIWVGNASNVAEPVAASGDVTLSNAGAFKVTQIQGVAVNSAAPTANQVLQYNGSQWVPTSLSASLPSLNDAQLWIGNASSVATAVTPSGDATISDTGAISVTKIQGKAISSTAPSANQVLQWNGSAWAPSTISTSPVGQALNSAQIWVGNASNLAEPVSISGDATISNSGAVTNTGLQGKAVSSTAPTSGQVLQFNGSSWVPTTPTVYQSTTLNDAKIWVGNSANTAAPVSMSGDATMTDTGAVTVSQIQGKAVASTAPSANQVLQWNGSAWAPSTISTSPVGQALNSAQIWVGNAGNLAAAVTMSGDATISNAGALTLNTVPVTKGGTGVTSYTLGQIPVYDGTKLTGLGCSAGQVLQWQAGTGFGCVTMSGVSPVGSALNDTQIWIGNSANVAAAVTPSGDATIADTGAITVTKLQGRSVASTAPSSNQVLQWNGSSWVPATLSGISPVGSSLTSGQIWVGNGSNTAAAVTPAGDVSMTNAGSFKVTQIQGVAVNSTAPTSGQVLAYNGSQWVATTSSSPTGSGTTNYVAKWTSSSALGNGMIYDNGTDVGIGTTSPSYVLSVADQNNAIFGLQEYSATDGAVIRGFRAQGTIASPSAVLAGDYLTALRGMGYTSAGSFTSATASIDIQAAENYTSTNQGANILFRTTPTGSTASSLERMRIAASGSVGINTTAPDSATKLDVAGAIRATNTTDNGAGAIDFSTGNTQFTSSSCGAFTMKNLRPGGNYTFVVQGTTSATCAFTMYTDSGTTTISSQKFVPANGPTINTKSTIYNIQVIGTVAYINWVPGF